MFRTGQFKVIGLPLKSKSQDKKDMFYLASFSEDSKTLIVNRGLSVIVITFLKKLQL